jgi:HSP20 family molecular chaperone IbpA
MRTRNSTALMWAQACEVLDQAERMHRQFFRLAAPRAAQAVWEPPVDVFEDEREVLVVVALPGVPLERIEVALVPGALLIREERQLSLFVTRRSMRQLEIPYGRFERRIGLPPGRFAALGHELVDGCLFVRLDKAEPL